MKGWVVPWGDGKLDFPACLGINMTLVEDVAVPWGICETVFLVNTA